MANNHGEEDGLAQQERRESTFCPGLSGLQGRLYSAIIWTSWGSLSSTDGCLRRATDGMGSVFKGG